MLSHAAADAKLARYGTAPQCCLHLALCFDPLLLLLLPLPLLLHQQSRRLRPHLSRQLHQQQLLLMMVSRAAAGAVL